MTLKEATGESVSIAQISRFENGQSKLSVDLLYEILNNVNTTPQEYYFLMGGDSEKALKDFFYRIIEPDGTIRETSILHAEIENLNKSKPNLYSWESMMIFFLESILKVRESEELDTDHYLLNYLMQVDNWGERELRMYAILGFVLPVDTTFFIKKTTVKRSEQYQGLLQDMKLLHTILANNISTFIFHDRLDYAEETLKIFEEKLSNNVELVESHLNLIFSKGMIAFKKKDAKKGIAYCEQTLDLCKVLKQNERGRMYRKRYLNWKENYDNPNFSDLTIEPGIVGFSLD